MEYLDGESLAERLKKGPLPLKEALGIGVDVCEALEAWRRCPCPNRHLSICVHASRFASL
jgi:hypothetical protein